MGLPAFPEIDEARLAAVAERHGFAGATVVPMPQVGVFNRLYAIGDRTILRLPREHPRFTDAVRNEARMVPAAREAGVRTPSLIVFDDSGDLLSVPYTLYERVEGKMLEGLVPDPVAAEAAWRELGTDLARLHLGVTEASLGGPLIAFEDKTDPRGLPEKIAADGYFTAAEARWLGDWLDRLAPAATAPVAQVYLHNDTQAANLMVDPATLAYRAVIDWGSARRGDPAHDFAGVPLRAVPTLLDGYRTLAPTDETFEARTLWRHLTLGLHQLRGTPKPDQSWAERPMTILLDVLRFFAEARDERWVRWG